NFLDAFCDATETPFGCVTVHKKVAIATRRWWDLSANELMLLNILADSSTVKASTSTSQLSKCISQDIPIFLIDESPTVPYRLLVFNLIRNVQVCLLCGSSPALGKLEKEIPRFWRPALDTLKSIRQIYPQNFQISATIDPNILGFLLVNNETHRCLSTVSPRLEDSQDRRTLSRKERIEILRSFYHQTIGSFFPSTIEQSNSDPSKFSHCASETYITTDSHKCYAIQSQPYQFFVLYNNDIPTYAMRNVTQKMLSVLTKDKSIQI
ncbi:protein fuzzy homolog, partial [Argonauta hians]